MARSPPSSPLPLRKPDAPAAPKAPPFAGLLQIVALIIALGNTPAWILQYIVTRPVEFKNVFGFLLVKLLRTMSLLYPFIPVPEAHGEAAGPPKLGLPARGELKKVTTTIVAVQAVPQEWRTVYATEVGGVQAVERPGFVLTPPGATAQGAALAKDGEKVILYIHGG